MSAPKVGDRVRVVLEGDVTENEPDVPYFVMGKPGSCNAIFTGPELAGEHVVSVEVIPKPLKVGDTIEGEQYESAPVGTVITERTPGKLHVIVKGLFEWRCVVCDHADRVIDERTVVYIPEATS